MRVLTVQRSSPCLYPAHLIIITITGSVTVHAPAGATPAVLKIEKMGNKGDGAVDYLVNITISCNK